jgi:hypothetical protein
MRHLPRLLRTAAAAACGALAVAPRAGAQVVAMADAFVLVRVTDGETLGPVADAEVWVGSSRRATDAAGRALVPVHRTRETLTVRRLGYDEATREIDTGDTPVEVALKPAAVGVNGVSARTRRMPVSPPLQEFYRRAAGGNGRFVTREQIAARHPRRLSDVFREIPGVRVLLGAQGERLAMEGAVPALFDGGERARAGDCPVQFYLEGVGYLPESPGVPNDVQPDEVEGIEVYRRLSEVPVEYRRPGAECGVVLIWLKESS